MNAAEIKAKVLDVIRRTSPNVENVIRMDLKMVDKVIYAAGTTLSAYKLFSQDTNTDKYTGNRSHVFPLPKGKVHVIHGIRCEIALKLSAAPSTALGYNEYLLARESYFDFRVNKTNLNPVYLSDTLTTNYVTQGGAIAYVPKQNFVAHYFSEPLIVDDKGDINITFEPAPGLATAAANGANPYAIINAAGSTAERGCISVELIASEWTEIL